MFRNIKVISILYAFLSISFWGISFVSTKALISDLDPYTLVSLRFGIASFFLYVLLLVVNERLRISLSDLQPLFILAVLGVFIHQIIQATALLTIDASAAGWIISFSPIFTAILAVTFLSERFTLLKLIGMAIAVIGVLFVTTQDSGSLQFSPNIGYFFMIASTLNWAIYSILIKKFQLPYSPLVVTFWISLIGFIMTIPFFIRSEGWTQVVNLAFGQWLHLIFLGVFVSGIAYWYWGKSLYVLEATQVTVLMYLEPLVTLIAAVILLQEKVILTTILGGLLIIVGVSLVNIHILYSLKNIWKK